MGEAMHSAGEKEVFLPRKGELLQASVGRLLLDESGVLNTLPGVRQMSATEEQSLESESVSGDGDRELSLAGPPLNSFLLASNVEFEWEFEKEPGSSWVTTGSSSSWRTGPAQHSWSVKVVYSFSMASTWAGSTGGKETAVWV